MVTQNHPSGFLPSIHNFIAAAFLSSTNQLVTTWNNYVPRWCLVLPYRTVPYRTIRMPNTVPTATCYNVELGSWTKPKRGRGSWPRA